MTNFEYLTQKENIRELAKELITIRAEEDNDYAIYNEYLVCSDGYEIWYFGEEDWNEAIEHEIEWLLEERSEE